MATRYAAFGTVLQRGDGATPVEAFASIAGVVNISGPQLGLDTVDASAHDSPDAWEQKVATLKRTGNVTFDLRWDPGDATYGLLFGDLDARTTSNFKLIFPDTGLEEWAFEAYVTQLGPTAPHDGVLGMSVQLTVTGEPDFTGS